MSGRNIKIEVLYPELSNLYGDYYNAKYLAKCIKDSEVIYTSNDDKPAFASRKKTDIIYMGSMSERNQEFAIERLMPYKDKIKSLIEGGTTVLATGNALEIFGNYILDGERKIPCLEALDFHAVRQMNDRRNCFFLGEYKDMKIVGHKGQFSFCEGRLARGKNIKVSGGFGINLKSKYEGIFYNNFYGTYILGPFLILNPYFVKHILKSLGLEAELVFEKEIIDAYNDRLARLEQPGTEFLMGAE